MSFGKAAAAAITDGYGVALPAREGMLKGAAMQLATPDAIREEDEEEGRRRNALLWTLGGLAGIGGLGVLAHQTGAFGGAKSWLEENLGASRPNLFQKALSSITLPTTAAAGLGAANVAGGFKPVQRYLPHGLRWLGGRSQTTPVELARDIQAFGTESGKPSRGLFEGIFTADDPHKAEIESSAKRLGEAGTFAGTSTLAKRIRDAYSGGRLTENSALRRAMIDPTLEAGPAAYRGNIPGASQGWFTRWLTSGARGTQALANIETAVNTARSTLADPSAAPEARADATEFLTKLEQEIGFRPSERTGKFPGASEMGGLAGEYLRHQGQHGLGRQGAGRRMLGRFGIPFTFSVAPPLVSGAVELTK